MNLEKDTHRRARGFTLVEMAIVIAITGLLLLAFSSFIKVYMQQIERDKNDEAVTEIIGAINRYYGMQGFYPCPAPPKAAPGSALRGVESRFIVTTYDTSAPPPPPLVPPASAIPALPTGVTAVPPALIVGGLIPTYYGRCRTSPTLGGGSPLGTNATTGITRANGYRVANPNGTVNIANLISTPSVPSATDPATMDDDTVYIGDIPYATLQLPERFTYDANNTKFIYAVSGSATHNNTFDIKKPNLTVQKFNFSHTGTTRTYDRQNISALFLIVAGGRDKVGVYNKQANILTPCLSVVEADPEFSRNENCDNDALFLSTGLSAGYTLGTNLGSTTHYFDDIISFTNSTATALWKPIDNTTNIRNLNTGNVGIGYEPNPYIKLDVDGNIRANKMITTRVCGDAAVTGGGINPTDNCFDVSLIVGDPDLPTPTGGHKCPADQVMKKVSSGAFVCTKPVLSTSWLAGKCCCPAPTYLTGFNADGSLRCAP